MKRILMVTVALVAMVAFVGGAVAQAPAKTEKPAAPAPAPAPAKAEKAAAPAPAPAPAAAPAAEKPKAEKPKAGKAAEKPKAMKYSGAVAAYEAGKMIAVKGKDKEMNFDVAPDAKVKGEVKEGAKVTVMYKKDGDKMVATSISVTPPPKPKEPAKKEEKKG